MLALLRRTGNRFVWTRKKMHNVDKSKYWFPSFHWYSWLLYSPIGLIPLLTFQVNKASCFRLIDHFHKWRPLLHSFVLMLIRPTALVLKQIFFWNLLFVARLVGLISIKTKEYFIWPPLWKRSMANTKLTFDTIGSLDVPTSLNIKQLFVKFKQTANFGPTFTVFRKRKAW